MQDIHDKITVIIPAYNEESTISAIIEDVLSIDNKIEIIVIDDGSTDNTGEIVDVFARKHPDKIRVIHHPVNCGKGNAIRTGLSYAIGDVIIIQDADLEYNPKDILQVVKPIMDGRAVVVYGSRVLSKNPRFSTMYYWGGRCLSIATNILYGTRITDVYTCHKAFKRAILKEIELKCSGFEFCAEVTAKIARAGYKIMEVPISYNPRSFKEGKKIRWKDGLIALYTLLKYRFIK